METNPTLRDRLVRCGQAHLVDHLTTLDEANAAAFREQLEQVPWEECADALRADVASHSGVLRPPVALRWKRQRAEGGLRDRLALQGAELLKRSKVATFLLAGGHGTRLGVKGPKGNVVFGPDEDRTLYRIHAERIARVQDQYGVFIPFYVLVNRDTEAATRAAFEEGAASWGLSPDQVTILVQGELPCFDFDGRALLSSASSLATAPDGHGGAHTVLRQRGVIEKLLASDVEVITTFQVDNPLGRPLDPVMLGWMLERQAHVVTKTVSKTSPGERVGVVARDVRGRHRIVEYSELPEHGAEDLTQGSIAIHAFSVKWLRDTYKAGFCGPLHRATKRSSYWTSDNGTVDPKEPNATKLERFIFDIFPHAPRLEVHEICRAWEFAPVKNRTGVDSLESARELVGAEVVRWHNEVGEAPEFPIALEPRKKDGAEAHQRQIRRPRTDA